MPSCVVKTCKNSSKSHKKFQGITFHLFPTNNETKTKWIVAIRNSRNDPEWLPSKSSVVCSDHFDNNDLYITNRGLRRVTKSGYPKKMLFSSSNVIAENSSSVSYSSASTFVQDLPDLPNAAVDCRVLPSASSAFVSDLPDLSNTAVDYTVLPIPSASSAIPPVLPVSPAIPKIKEEEDITFDIPRKHKMHLKDKIIRNCKKKIKILQQRVRRLKNRNKSLKDIIRTLK